MLLGGQKHFMEPPWCVFIGSALKENFLVSFPSKYCNSIVNMNYSALGCISDDRSYVMIFFPRRKSSFMYEGIVV
jgi:hypothetical protein